MKKSIRTTYILTLLAATALIGGAQSKSNLDSRIGNLLTQFYFGVERPSNDNALAAILADEFVFTSKDGNRRGRASILTSSRETAASPEKDPFFGPVSNSVDVAVKFTIQDLRIVPVDSRAKFTAVLTTVNTITLRDDKTETARSRTHSTLEGTVVKQGNNWLLFDLTESPFISKDPQIVKAEAEESAQYEKVFDAALDLAERRSEDIARRSLKANTDLRNEVNRLFGELGLVTSSLPATQREGLKSTLADDFVATSETADGSNNAPAFKVLPMILRQEAVAKKTFTVSNRNMHVVQNGETVIATYDTVYYRNVDGRPEFVGRERHMSVFLRRGGKLLWAADHSAKLPEGEYNESPRGWVARFASKYRMGIDVNTKNNGNNSVFIQRDAESDPTKGVEMTQTISTLKYRGKRVQLTAYVRSENVVGDGDIFLLTDTDSLQSLDLMSMFGGKPGQAAEAAKSKGRISGTSDWRPLTVTIDVPQNAKMLTVSALLRGSGKIWLDDLSLKVVDATVPTSYSSDSAATLPLPGTFPDDLINADFEDN